MKQFTLKRRWKPIGIDVQEKLAKFYKMGVEKKGYFTINKTKKKIKHSKKLKKKELKRNTTRR